MTEKTPVTIGRIVHFYDKSLSSAADKEGVNLNGHGAGPYAATVIQAGGDYTNLLVHAWGGDWREGSVSEKTEGATRYWEYPPLQVPACASAEKAAA